MTICSEVRDNIDANQLGNKKVLTASPLVNGIVEHGENEREIAGERGNVTSDGQMRERYKEK